MQLNYNYFYIIEQFSKFLIAGPRTQPQARYFSCRCILARYEPPVCLQNSFFLFLFLFFFFFPLGAREVHALLLPSGPTRDDSKICAFGPSLLPFLSPPPWVGGVGVPLRPGFDEIGLIYGPNQTFIWARILGPSKHVNSSSEILLHLLCKIRTKKMWS